MTDSVAVYAILTVPGFPLGQPEDGRPRYGMTPDQADLYRWLVAHKPHGEAFGVNFRETAWRMARHPDGIFKCARSLVERGWLESEGGSPNAVYRFVHPVMKFKPTEGK